MTVQAIRLSNFLVFEDSGWIELRPIMFVYGHNSSGKSAIGHAFNILQQTMARDFSNDQTTTIARIKNFSDIVHRRSDGLNNINHVVFGFRCLPGLGLVSKVSEFSRFRDLNISDTDPVIFTLHFAKMEGAETADEGILTSISIDLAMPTDLNDTPNNKTKKTRILAIQRNDAESDNWSFTSEILDIQLATDLLQQITLDVNQTPPILKAKEGELFDLTRIELTQEQAEDEGFDPYKDPNDPRNIVRYIDSLFQALMNDIVGSFETTTSIRAAGQGLTTAHSAIPLAGSKYSHLRKIIEILIRNVFFHGAANPDIGVMINRLLLIENDNIISNSYLGDGVYQFTKIILSLLNTERDSLIILEHPDALLDPKAQMELSDFFLFSSLLGQKRLIIETNSEYLVLRIMKRVKQWAKRRIPDRFKDLNVDISHDKIGLFVAKRNSNGSSKLSSAFLNNFGEFEFWPGGFFEEGFRERFYEDAP